MECRFGLIRRQLTTAWAERGIIGSGVLIDYCWWPHEHERPYNPLETLSISLANLQDCAATQGLEFRKGDILFIRSGFIDTYSRLEIHAREKIASVNPPHFAGVEQSDDALEWILNQQFTAVAGDAPSFETWRISLYNLAKCSCSKGLSLT
jgi:hypothetical protein